MSQTHMARDIEEASVPVVREAELAAYLERQGNHVVEHRGRHWQGRRGLYRPVNWLARLTAQQATRPTTSCLGYAACLDPSDAVAANAATPLYLLSDLASLDEGALPGSRRHKLRRARQRAQLAELTGPALLRDQGYEVLRSAHRRNGYGTLPTQEQYLAGLERRIGDPAYGIVLAGVVEGRLGGYLSGYAVDGTAFVREVVVATEALDTHLSTGLTYEFVYACRRSPHVQRLVHGFHARENEGLCRYKDWLGFPLELVPTKAALLPGLSVALRRIRPHAYYRLTGRG